MFTFLPFIPLTFIHWEKSVLFAQGGLGSPGLITLVRCHPRCLLTFCVNVLISMLNNVAPANLSCTMFRGLCPKFAILAMGPQSYRSIIHEFKAGAKISQPNVSIHIQQNVVRLDVSAGKRATFNNQYISKYSN